MNIRTILDIDEMLATDRLHRSVEIEIGCGNGHFLAEYAAKKPELFVLGIDVKRRRCLKTLKKVERQSLHNVSVVYGKAEALLDHVPDGIVSQFHLYFPDPWPKTKHRRRRFLRFRVAQELCRALAPGGALHFATDVLDYYIQAKVVCLMCAGMNIAEIRVPEEIRNSLFGQRMRDSGRAVYQFSAVKTSPSAYEVPQTKENEPQVDPEVREDEHRGG